MFEELREALRQAPEIETRTIRYSRHTTTNAAGKVISERVVLDDGGSCETPEQVEQLRKGCAGVARQAEKLFDSMDELFEGLFGR